jgi:hypothetical protein
MREREGKCAGYKAPGEVRFRDESTNVVRKFKAKEARAKKAISISITPSSMSGEDHDTRSEESLEIAENQIQQSPSLWPVLAPTIEERGIGFFVTNYVLWSCDPSQGYRN